MTQKTVHRNYKKQMALAMVIYLAGAVCVAYLRKNTGTSVPILVLIA